MAIENYSLIFRREAKFIAGSSKISQVPYFHIPEVAFIGRSNVGKSSVINMVCNRRSLARVSHTPGRTQQINFFSLDDRLILVDLPGYGFAKVPVSVKKQWESLITEYLKTRENLKLINVLIDGKLGIKDSDKEVIDFLIKYGRNFQIVLTKADKSGDLNKIIELSKNYIVSLGQTCNVIATSSRSKKGAKELQLSLSQYAK